MTSSAGRVAGSGGCSSCISRTGSSSRGIFISSVWGISVAATERAACTLRGPAASFTALFCRCGSRCRRGLCGGLLPYFDGGLSGFRLGNTRPTGFLGSFGGALLRFGIRNASVLREIQNFFDKVLFFIIRRGIPSALPISRNSARLLPSSALRSCIFVRIKCWIY